MVELAARVVYMRFGEQPMGHDRGRVRGARGHRRRGRHVGLRVGQRLLSLAFHLLLRRLELLLLELLERARLHARGGRDLADGTDRAHVLDDVAGRTASDLLGLKRLIGRPESKVEGLQSQPGLFRPPAA